DSAPAALRIPIGPNGQIDGTLSDQPRHSLAVPLFDPALYKPRKRMVDAHVELSVAQQLVLRAAVVGAHVEIHTLRPDRWQQLVSAVGDRSSVRLAGGAAEQAADAGTVEPEPAQQPVTVAVFDCLAPSATAASTTLAISDPGTPTRSAAHLTIEQVADNTVSVALPMGRVRVDLVEPLGEGRYLDAGQARVLTPESGGGTP
ncbi:MAG: hypothetical protein HOQ24_19210, partial [Mycobacteriaceae bacterium]|nr:hypothetical protein [Mycobacteriaceae bacterium]